MLNDQKNYIGNPTTGRTSRMLRDALQVAIDGKKVLVIAYDMTHRRELRMHAEEILREIIGMRIGKREDINVTDFSIAFDEGGEVQFMSSRGNSHWDWAVMNILQWTDQLYVDHYAIEMKFNEMLSMLHRWDEKEKG